MTDILVLVGLVVAVFVGFNIGGSNTGVAFGPAVGSRTVSKLGAGVLMGIFALLGGWTVGRRVVTTLGSDLIIGDPFTVTASVVILLFIGLALFVSNLFGIPASTSMTAVGAVAGYGLATDRLAVQLAMEIVSWWLVAPILGFWLSAVVGRYVYDDIASVVAIDRSDGPLVVLRRDGVVPVPALGAGTTPRELTGSLLVVAIGCFMAFSAGASNVANAVAPLVGNGSLSMNAGILLAGGAIAIGALTIARRTLETMGNELTELPLTAALVVATVSATLVTVLSLIGIPASFVVIATMSTVGLGWGRETTRERTYPVADPATLAGPTRSGIETVAAGRDSDDTSLDVDEPATLYRPVTTARVIFMQNIVPAVATVGAYSVFSYVDLAAVM
ncbi:inorganic phosphate transporter [Halogeometricum borinquense]|uniref:Phosphate transporter n=1 Tax=Halogeometricum borinquense TaxID=60847 RepID=A0A6C0ULA5_9EURY|nr:inorganic phosphate transporter [Halogeometricum borinquense]QIB76285.1 inorganic phosphate transporter [Halogeometricum borinquense]QIQ75281.1 inorganic phosphate transporter [Halogeometricum borinquense]